MAKNGFDPQHVPQPSFNEGALYSTELMPS